MSLRRLPARPRTAVAAASLAVLTLAACGKGEGPRGSKEHPYRIAVIPKGTAHIFWLSVQSGALAAGKEFDVEVAWNGPAQETEYERQMQILDSVIARRVDGIAIAASERKALLGSIDRAMSQGIPVVVFDSGIDSTNYVSYIATDNVEAGRMAFVTHRSLAGYGSDHRPMVARIALLTPRSARG